MDPNLFKSTEDYALGLKDKRRIDNCLNHYKQGKSEEGRLVELTGIEPATS
jgi:hypothetical protein